MSKLRIKIYWFISWCGKPYFYYHQAKYKKIVAKKGKKERLKVAFFAFQDSIWKYDSLYKKLENHPKFDPVIVVIPYVTYGHESMLAEMNKTTKALANKGYKVIKSYNENTKKFMSVKKEIDPDLIFFTTPFRLTSPEYQISNYLDRLTAYVPYGFMTIKMKEDQYNQMFHNLVWRCYYETPIHKEMAKNVSHIKAKNVVVTGYPPVDTYLNTSYKPKEVWKNLDTRVKRIIWAPHHTLKANISMSNYSNFLTYSEFFFELIEKLNHKIQVAFKPHPILKLKLYKHPEWGKERTDKYYLRWATTPNCQLEEGDYDDLFLTSDALIHDSISFISEYCLTGKPMLFTVSDNKVTELFNTFGSKAFQLSYMAYNEVDIVQFVENVVLNGNDSRKNERLTFVNDILKPPNNQTAVNNIINDLIENIWQKSNNFC
ncbi:MAG TPA: CDP-glycerol glycerophosphotransferase family protein [Bacteroidales bacterium]|nr:CDP-glycerol glycerophosphotransferase family protein [Bacteroidales bacterium]